MEFNKISGNGYLRSWCNTCFHVYFDEKITLIQENYEETNIIALKLGGYSSFF